MGFLRRLFGRTTHSAQPTEQLAQTLLTFIEAGDRAESQRIVEQHQELLGDEADLALQARIAAQSDAGARRMLEVHRGLLQRCREVGISTAFGELANALVSPGTANSGELPAILEELTSLAQTGTVAQRIELCRRALQLVSMDTQAELWAALQVELGTDSAQSPTGDRAENMEAVIAAYRQAMKVYTRPTFSKQWAATQNNLGNAYNDRICGERAENVEAAIAAHEQALEVFTRKAYPEQWAMTQYNLGAAYRDRCPW